MSNHHFKNLGGISATFGGYISDIFLDVSNFCMKTIWGVYQRHLGGISATFGGYISDKCTPVTRRNTGGPASLNLLKTKVKTL